MLFAARSVKSRILSLGLVVFGINAAYSYCIAAEFSNDDVAPTIDVFILTEDLIAIAVDPGYRMPNWETYPRFFVAERPAYEFERISEEEFSRVLSVERYERRFNTYPVYPEGQPELPSWYEVSPSLCSEYDYNSGASTTKTFGSGDLRVAVDISCQTRISRAISVEDEVWLGTYQSGEFGDYAAEGLLVLSTSGTVLDQIDVKGPIKEIVKDPWGPDIFALSRYGLTAIEPNYRIAAVRWPVHQFDQFSMRPDVVFSSDWNGTDPLAVIAYSLGEDHYEEFARLTKSSTYSPHSELLYQYYMSSRASNWAEPAYLPDELDPLLDSAESTPQWGQFSCFLRSDRAKTMCDEWLGSRGY